MANLRKTTRNPPRTKPKELPSSISKEDQQVIHSTKREEIVDLKAMKTWNHLTLLKPPRTIRIK